MIPSAFHGWTPNTEMALSHADASRVTVECPTGLGADAGLRTRRFVLRSRQPAGQTFNCG
jgi:hypothetical protein